MSANFVGGSQMSEQQSLVLIPPPHFPVTIEKVLVRVNEVVSATTVLATYTYGSSRIAQCRALRDGVVEEIHVKDGEVAIDARRPLFVIGPPCTHPQVFGGLCGVCGTAMPAGQESGFRITHDSRGVIVSPEEAARIEREITTRLLMERKLSLFVDLDQTVVHTTSDRSVGDWMRDPTHPSYSAVKDIHVYKLPGDDFRTFYTKVRPGTKQLLADMAKLYEMHIYTAGTREYAEEIAKLLDPNKDIFGGRILSRDDTDNPEAKSIKRIYPCDQSMVVVVDDRVEVWDDTANIIQVKPYRFFAGPKTPSPKRTTFGVTGLAQTKSLGEGVDAQELRSQVAVAAEDEQRPMVIDEHKECAPLQQQLKGDSSVPFATDDPASKGASQLPTVLMNDDREMHFISDVLKRVHSIFYDRKHNSQEADVRTIIPAMKKVFNGVAAVFSVTRPSAGDVVWHCLWRSVRFFGGECHLEISPDVTHVVAEKKNTRKVLQAMKIPGVAVVSLDWITTSINKCKREPVHPYLLTPILEGPGSQQDDSDAGLWDDFFCKSKLNEDDWKDMDAEVDRALNEASDDEEDLMGGLGERMLDYDDSDVEMQEVDEDEEWEGLDEEIEEGMREIMMEYRKRKRRSRSHTPSPRGSRESTPNPPSSRAAKLIRVGSDGEVSHAIPK
ncbi:Carboxy-terminal domain (CTD) phosphatase [Borealophlyctis nickersoniae]|nr:Carboxy-terminal domain (CTD) phosphatase [Borealophlyctis nickersoniae]